MDWRTTKNPTVNCGATFGRLYETECGEVRRSRLFCNSGLEPEITNTGYTHMLMVRGSTSLPTTLPTTLKLRGPGKFRR
jgi:hypothetical protein